ncbi:MAG: DNA polymerase III subunit delta [Alphaproteobacteria bacterium]|jgi:DNA polymerase-3 subunit delta|nr:DNA polymerase III subunit delta [Alphaproteobacteria bacterium]
MKITTNNIATSINNLPPHTRVVLLYGADYGLVEERSITLKNNFLGKDYEDSQYIQIYESTFKENLNIIAEQAYSIALFGENKKCIVVNEAKDFLSKKLGEYLEKPDPTTLLIIKAGELSPSSSLRKLCENADESVLAIPAYVDTPATMRQNIAEKLKKEGINIESSALNLLVALLGNDRGITNSEIEKIAIYAAATKNISVNDVDAIIANNALGAVDKFVYACFDLETNLAYSMVNILLEENNPIVLVRSIASHIQKLLLVKILMNDGTNIDMAMKEIKPPIFFTQVNSFKNQVMMWSADKLKKLLEQIIYLEISLKTNGNIDEILLKDMILKRFLKK